jgi:ferritin-like metal-binding protein YciE
MTHREKTQGHIERLEQVFEMIGKRPQTKPCRAINGIVAEGEETVEGSARASRSIQVWLRRPKRSNTMRWRATAPLCMGRSLKMPKAAALLNESLREEMKPEKLLTQIGASKADKIAAAKMAG